MINLFNCQEEISNEFNSVKQEYDMMWKQHCKELYDKLNVLTGKLKLAKTVSYIYSGHPLKRHQGEYGLTISEPMSSHNRYAIWFNTAENAGWDIQHTGIFFDGEKEVCHFDSERRFFDHADDWVIDGKLPDNSYIA